jgi:hypothetical protein
MLLGLGTCPGTPWRPSWDGDPKKHKKTHFGRPSFWSIFGTCDDVFCSDVFYMFSKPLFFHLFTATGMLLETMFLTSREQVGFTSTYVLLQHNTTF